MFHCWFMLDRPFFKPVPNRSLFVMFSFHKTFLKYYTTNPEKQLTIDTIDWYRSCDVLLLVSFVVVRWLSGIIYTERKVVSSQPPATATQGKQGPQRSQDLGVVVGPESSHLKLLKYRSDRIWTG